MRIAITGGSGLIGRHVAPELASDHDVVICDIEEPPSQLLEHDSIEFRKCDVRISDDVIEAVADCDAIFHKVGLKGGVNSMENPHQYYEVNVGGTVNVIEACRQEGINNVVYDSTESVFGTGNDDGPFDETAVPLPSSIYGGTKRLSEVYLTTASHIDATILRYPRIVFPESSNAITRFYRMVVRQEHISLHNEGLNSFDFVHVEDVISTHESVIETGFPCGIFHVATDDEIRLDSLVEEIGRAVGIKPEFERLNRAEVDEEIIEDDLLPHLNSLNNDASKEVLNLSYEFPKVHDVIEDTLSRISHDNGSGRL